MSIEQTAPRNVTAAAAIAAACLIGIPAVIAPHVERHPVMHSVTGNIIDLAGSISDLAGGLGGDGATALAAVADALTSTSDLGSALSLVADAPAADAITDWWNDLQNSVSQFLSGLWMAFVFFVWGPVGAGLQYAWQWLAETFGFDPYPAAAEALDAGLDPSALAAIVDPGALANLDTLFDATGIADLGAQLSAGLFPDLADVGV